MTQESIKRHIIRTVDSVKYALDRLDTLSGKTMVMFATDAEDRLQGTVTGGDIRRALLRGISLETPVAEAMNRSFTAIEKDDDPAEKVAEGKRRHLCLLPVTDDGHISDIIDLTRLKALLPIDVVLMAGGRGERLRPLTLSIPKPLLAVGGKPIIDRNIEMLEEYGVRNIFVTVNYLHNKIEEHFRIRNAKETDNHADVTCVLEPKTTRDARQPRACGGTAP